MINADKVRYSRDGDQFHYLWAARRCLPLLVPTSGLVAVSIEGPSERETASSFGDEGEEVIDVAEYYGSEAIESADLVRYLQLKHSTLHSTSPWAPSGLEKTLRGFSDRYRELAVRLGRDRLEGRIEFKFVSNRPISPKIIDALDDILAGRTNRHGATLDKLKDFTSLDTAQFVAFCKVLKLEGSQEQYRLQRAALTSETRAYLPGDDTDAPIRLKELVTRKALSESVGDSTIRRTDVLRALEVSEDKLFPAPSRTESIANSVQRAQEIDLASEIIGGGATFLIHAAAGVGKSIIAQRISKHLPQGSVSVVYDCFGNGEYRRPAHPRHRHKDALVQIANELAGRGLCDPLIPSSNADNADYLKAFIHRLRQCTQELEPDGIGSVICIVIDAADNAAMAAEELGERSFARDLLREIMPERTRLVVLCRTERRAYLDPPPTVRELELKPFNRAETAEYLRTKFADATENDVDEFHRLSSHNPRVQANALARFGTLPALLRSLGPNPTSVDEAIAAQLRDALAGLKDRAANLEKPQIDLICAGLAILRPLIPISVLSAVSGANESGIRSFATDFGRPLLVIGETVQFRDEPVETWFRQQYKATAEQLKGFIGTLKPLADTIPYVASSLPPLMLEAGQLDELISLALTTARLPVDSPIEKRDIELQRLQFALKASLRAQRHVDATMLALKTGEEAAGSSRQQKLVQENTDLAAAFLEQHTLEEIVARRQFGGSWLGAHHAYEAGLLSQVPALKAEASSRLRMAYEWLANWSRLSQREKREEQVDDQDIVEMAIAQFNLHGPDTCARELRRWSPREVAFRVGRTVARRFIDHERYEDLDRLAESAGNNLFLSLAITQELGVVGRTPPKRAVLRALRLLESRMSRIEPSTWDAAPTLIRAISAIVEAACVHSLSSNDALVGVLDRCLPTEPPRVLSSRYGGWRDGFLRGYSLRSALKGEPLELISLAHAELKVELEKKDSHQSTREVQEFKEGVGALLPWYSLRAATFVAAKDHRSLKTAIADALKQSASANVYNHDKSDTSDEIAHIWFSILLKGPGDGADLLSDFRAWVDHLRRPLFTPTWIELARIAARSEHAKDVSQGFCLKAFTQTKDSREDAASKASTYVEIARALLSLNKPEAKAYFDQAIDVASKLGDEIFDRWEAMLDLADRAADPARPRPDTAYRFARCGEVASDYLDKHFDWRGTVSAVCGLSPSSGLAVVSRWRDRKVGFFGELLATAVHFLVKHRFIDPEAASSLIPFEAEWHYEEIVEPLLGRCDSIAKCQQVLDHVLSFMRLEEQSSSTWTRLHTLATAHSVRIEGIDELITSCLRREASLKAREESNSQSGLSTSVHKATIDWATVFPQTGPYTPGALSDAYTRFRHQDPPWHHEEFWEEIVKRVPTGEAPALIRAVSEATEFSLYSLTGFFKAIPADWRSLMSVRHAIRDALSVILKTYCLEITKSRRFQVFPLNLAADISGIPESELVDAVLLAIGERTEVVDAARLFSLVGLLVSKLSPDQARQALEFALELFEDDLTPSDGDGPWSSALKPPDDLHQAIAGFVWASLAAPETAFRWQAAHAVRGFCTLGQAQVVNHLVGFASSQVGGAFADGRLHFYDLHARLWLLIGFARAALETPELLVPHAELFIHYALDDEPHLLIRHFAALSARELQHSGLIQFNAGVASRLRDVNVSPLPAVPSQRYERQKPGGAQDAQESRSERFTFGYDISRYWFDSLGDRFAKTPSEIELEAEQVIWDDWKLTHNGHWNADERANRGLYRDRETWHSHGSYPKTHDLNFYLSYHAMLTVAGKLLATAPLHQSPDEGDEFQDWLERHLLTRGDGRWLADRRDPKPLEWPAWKDEVQNEDWRWSVARPDFARVLAVGQQRLNVWGRWSTVAGSREEVVYVTSALVSPDRSTALLRALQTVTNPYDYRLPNAGDESEIDEPGFQLKGWVETTDREKGLDGVDPWAGDIQYPPLRPAQFVVDGLSVTSDAESRVWKRQTESELSEEVTWSQLWGTGLRDDGESEGEYGQRLQATQTFLRDLLVRWGRDLIIKVNIERRVRRARYESYKDDGLGYVYPYSQLFLLRANGQLQNL
jgi:ribosomal protein L30/L7E